MRPCSDPQHQLSGRERVQRGMGAGQRSQISKWDCGSRHGLGTSSSYRWMMISSPYLSLLLLEMTRKSTVHTPGMSTCSAHPNSFYATAFPDTQPHQKLCWDQQPPLVQGMQLSLDSANPIPNPITHRHTPDPTPPSSPKAPYPGPQPWPRSQPSPRLCSRSFRVSMSAISEPRASRRLFAISLTSVPTLQHRQTPGSGTPATLGWIRQGTAPRRSLFCAAPDALCCRQSPRTAHSHTRGPDSPALPPPRSP